MYLSYFLLFMHFALVRYFWAKPKPKAVESKEKKLEEESKKYKRKDIGTAYIQIFQCFLRFSNSFFLFVKFSPLYYNDGFWRQIMIVCANYESASIYIIQIRKNYRKKSNCDTACYSAFSEIPGIDTKSHLPKNSVFTRVPFIAEKNAKTLR